MSKPVDEAFAAGPVAAPGTADEVAPFELRTRA
jgi:hypothetical protein